MGRVGRYVQLKAREGQRDLLVEHMLGVAQLLADVPGCEIYVINTSAADTDPVWVTEVWGSQAELDASLSGDRVKASVEQVVSLLAGPPSASISCRWVARTSSRIGTRLRTFRAPEQTNFGEFGF